MSQVHAAMTGRSKTRRVAQSTGSGIRDEVRRSAQKLFRNEGLICTRTNNYNLRPITCLLAI
jgi:hypothetical protein